MKILSNKKYSELTSRINRLEEELEEETGNHLLHMGEQQLRVNKMAKIFREVVGYKFDVNVEEGFA